MVLWQAQKEPPTTKFCFTPTPVADSKERQPSKASASYTTPRDIFILLILQSLLLLGSTLIRENLITRRSSSPIPSTNRGFLTLVLTCTTNGTGSDPHPDLLTFLRVRHFSGVISSSTEGVQSRQKFESLLLPASTIQVCVGDSRTQDQLYPMPLGTTTTYF